MVLKKVASWIINFTIFFLIITFSPGLGPKTAFPFEEFSVEKPRALEGVLASNDFLANPEKLFEGQLKAPEHLLERDGVIYASLGSGEVVKIIDGKIEVMSRFGKFCYRDDSYPHCGRPLGLAFDTKGNNLIVMDSSVGIFELNIDTNKLKIVVLAGESFGSPRREAKFLNSVAVASNGDLYYTDSSADFQMHQTAMAFLANPSGRLVYLKRGTKQPKVLLDNLWFANGIALSPDEDFLVVSDLNRNKLMRYWLKTEKAGTADVFADRLPGGVDNITPDGNGFWAALALTSDPDHPYIFQSMAPLSYLRRFIARILFLVEMLFKKIDYFYPNKFSKNVVARAHSLPTYSFLMNNRATVLRFDWNGNILAAYHSYDNSVYTHVLELKGKLYLGSFVHDYIARVDRQKHN